MKESPSHLECACVCVYIYIYIYIFFFFFPGREGKNMLTFTVGFIALSGYAFCGSAGMQVDMIL